MKHLILAAAATLAASLVLAASPAPSLAPADVVTRVAAQDSGLQSYSSRVAFDMTVHALVDLHVAPQATYYFKRPDKVALNFDSLPLIASQFKHLYASIGTPDTWAQTYDISFASQPVSGKPFSLQLVPKKRGNVQRLIVTVNPSYEIVGYEWRYYNGGSIVMTQQNQKVGGYLLPSSQTSDFNIPGYKAHAVANYSQYKVNIDIPDSVFS